MTHPNMPSGLKEDPGEVQFDTVCKHCGSNRHDIDGDCLDCAEDEGKKLCHGCRYPEEACQCLTNENRKAVDEFEKTQDTLYGKVSELANKVLDKTKQIYA